MSRIIHVLAIEDSEDDVKLAMRLLRRSGFAPQYRRVQSLPTLQAALADESWDAVISDFSMPGFTGLDALRAFRRTGLDVPFIFVSGTMGEETAVAAMKAGASDYVMKQNMNRLAPVLERELMQAATRAAHRHAEAELRKYEAQLRQAQKMESIGTLAGGIAHDFNNILGAILGHVEIARGELALAHPVLASLDEIQTASLRARDLVRQILTFSRRQPQLLLTQRMRPVVEETYRLLRATLPAHVDIQLQLSDAPLYAHADATQVQQVLMNLCTNAWHALGGAPGRIRIGLEEIALDTSTVQDLGNLVSGPHLHLWVEDSGIGMDAATRERIFDPFFTTKPVGQGTGLGLAVVHGIVSAHQGAIRVESEPGRGSAFHLYFPLVEQVDAARPDAAPIAGPPRGHGEHVLYLDDDETMVLVVERLLARAGYRCSGFHNAQEAIEALRSQPDSVDFVVTDLNMPDRSGLDVAREMVSIKPELPVVISSGLITDEMRELARDAGVRGMLEKESTFQDLGRLVGHILASNH
ncbi:response regulator [Roseateles sp. DAIF2]|uniref:hybrid sensor histidine kinase/response regulator n=1 Tax=Roseateles sp. DAIF2 TaxID=2714952 RepID=UPI0018A26479|nr:response regulator [Roseateles sp. DAIF2]QPF75620.1 response regulator [Roseateles sp. DAIF2]